MPRALFDVWKEKLCTCANTVPNHMRRMQQRCRIIWPSAQSSLSAHNKQPLTKVPLLLFNVKIMKSDTLSLATAHGPPGIRSL